MSTRSIIAKADDDGFRQGVYVHGGGSPTVMGATLFELWSIHGAGLHDILSKGGAWSSLVADNPAPEWVQQTVKNFNGRAAWLPGVGVHHIEDDGFRFDWHGEDLDTDCEWVYALDNKGMCTAFLISRSKPHAVASFSLDGEQPDWNVVECGSDFKRCKHSAWFHFPEAGNISTATYLGRVPLCPEDACGVIDENNVEWELTGSGSRERLLFDQYGPRWFSVAKCGDKCMEIWTWSDGDEGQVANPNITLIYPAIREAA